MTNSSDPRRLIVVGAGGVGSWLCAGLARLLQFSMPGSALIIVDGDTYEPKNMERQNFSAPGNKAISLAQDLQPQFPEIYVLPEDRWVVEESDEDSTTHIGVKDLLKEGDVVYATVDNFAARAIIFDAARDFDNIDVFTGGNDDNLYGSVYHYQRRDGHDITDHPVEYHPELADPPDRNPGELSCQERLEIEGGTQLLATNMAVAAFLLARTHKVIVKGEQDNEAEIMFDLGLGLSQPYNRVPDPVTVSA